MNPDTWIERGEIHVDDKVAFRTIADALRCMGRNYKQYQRGVAAHPHEPNIKIWFPKLYPNGVWENDYNEAAGIITERNIKNPAAWRKHIDECLRNVPKQRVVFGRVKDNLGHTQYKFRGLFRFDRDSTKRGKGVVWKRVRKKVKTHAYA